MTDEVLDYESIFDEDAETPEFKLELLSLRLSHMITQAMEDRCMNKTDLARALDVSAPMVTKILSGRSNFTLKTLVWVADALDYEFEPVFRAKEYVVASDFTFTTTESERMKEAMNQWVEVRLTSLVEPAATDDSTRLPWDFNVCDAPEDELPELQAA